MNLEGKISFLKSNLDLPASEWDKINKFIGSISSLSEDELRGTIEFLKNNSTKLTEIKQLKILNYSATELSSKYNILDDGNIHETELYRKNPYLLLTNKIDLYQKINYCIQNMIPYKDENGMPKDFLFNEKAWEKVTTHSANLDTQLQDVIKKEPVEDNLINIKPDDIALANDDLEIDSYFDNYKPKNEEPNVSVLETEKPIVFVDDDLKELEAHTTSFANLKEELKKDINENDSFMNNFAQNLNDTLQDLDLNFGDIDPEEYSVGMRK